MRTFYFHCTDGERLILDRHGARLSTNAEIRAHAADTLADVIESNPAALASGWLVCVFNEAGRQVDVLTLDDLRQDAHPDRAGALPKAA